MRIGGGGSTDFNQLQSDSAQFRNKDFLTNEGLNFGGFTFENESSGNYSHVQLINPSGSAVTILLDGIIATTGGATAVSVSTHNTALSGDDGNLTNLKLGGTAGVGELRSQTNSSTYGTRLFYANVLASAPLYIPFPYPIMLAAAKGIVVHPSGTNLFIGCNFMCREL
mgnify:CR=1 FL=1